MEKQVFINLPVTDLAVSTGFYEALGFTKNPIFSDDTQEPDFPFSALKTGHL